jgi:uncharacterized protein YpuA (DUF1002 family)
MSLKDAFTTELIRELRNRGVINILWTNEDIIETAKNLEVELTDEEIDDVTTLMEEKHDANYGVNWSFIEECIWQVIDNRKKSKT